MKVRIELGLINGMTCLALGEGSSLDEALDKCFDKIEEWLKSIPEGSIIIKNFDDLLKFVSFKKLDI